MNSNLFEITTDENDPTNVTLRRLSTEEINERMQAEFIGQLEHNFPQWFDGLQDKLVKLTSLLKEIPMPIDQKKEARERSKDDLNRKRKDLMKRRGK